MVTAATTFARNGVADWIIQRFSALILAAYTVFLAVVITTTSDMDYNAWSNLFAQTWVRIFTLLAILSVAAHGWIGLWGVVTDYFTTRLLGTKGLVLRLVILGAYAMITIAFVAWGIEILWGAK